MGLADLDGSVIPLVIGDLASSGCLVERGDIALKARDGLTMSVDLVEDGVPLGGQFLGCPVALRLGQVERAVALLAAQLSFRDRRGGVGERLASGSAFLTALAK
ncbi:hypothetical protein DVB88_02615 [Tsukamurella pulmonis]|nr:hypothetical protein DVB88_02615 [Tsukamurella pulmonis]